MKLLGIIPARGGSKGIPKKNIIEICEKPLISYTIEKAIESELFADLVVSTDADSIIKVCEKYKCAYIKRPLEIAGDKSSVSDTILHVLNTFKTDNKEYDAIMLLQPTAPIREVFHLQQAYDLLKSNKDISSVISVCEMNEMHPARMYNIHEGELVPFLPELENTRRQEIPPVYYRNGSIYLVKTSEFLRQKTVMAKPSAGYVIDKKYLLNIDEKRDLLIAEALIKAWKRNRL